MAVPGVNPILALGLLLPVLISSSPEGGSPEIEHLWAEFVAAFRPDGHFSATVSVQAARYKIFEGNLLKIGAMNEKGAGIYSHMSPFADWTAEEFRAMQTLGRGGEGGDAIGSTATELFSFPGARDPPAAFDWREHGAVSAVKNQGSCGSCWAFSVIGNLEGAYHLKLNGTRGATEITQLSEFEIVECDTEDHKCNGGLPSTALQFLQDKRLPVVPQADYRYFVPELLWNPRCHPDRLKKHPLFYVRSWAFIGNKGNATNDEGKLAQALVTHGPLSVGLNAAGMQFYFGGVADPRKWIGCDPDQLDHGVTLVGYGVDAKSQKPYWSIKNSWGSWWGERGYYRLLRGQGVCGISSMVTTVTEIQLVGTKERPESPTYV